MSFKGRVVSRKKIDTPLGKVELTTTEHEAFIERKKVIWGMCVEKFAEVGSLITIHRMLSRENDFTPVKYEPLYYKVKLTDDADSEHAIEMTFSEAQDEYEFDSEDEAMEFIELLKVKGFKHATVIVDTQAEFKRWEYAYKEVFGAPLDKAKEKKK